MTRRAVPSPENSAIARLADDVHRLTRDVARLADLPALVATHARLLSELNDTVHQLRRLTHQVPAPRNPDGTRDTTTDADDAAPNGAEPDADVDEVVAAPAWLTVTDPQIAVGWLAELAVWVPQVWQPHLQTKTPNCWPWHPAVVAELLVVAHLWDEAVSTDEPGPAPLAAWHDRWRPGAAARVTRLMAGCERAHGRHKAHGHEYLYDVAYLDELAHWWATTHAADPAQPAPGLTLDRDGR
ncbi:hypothetical protein [Kineosporia sp. R_H_3]|uniref:hypothetical protein n=1 Tax=Kineosporia sp. R_H_3 TaxID=1961848 RepID=UPI000B4B5282|nr:hypothetical protein [Kineosporia sp. R_H_3]MBI4941423.1 hypothetical protein [Actinomycetota bacterium]